MKVTFTSNDDYKVIYEQNQGNPYGSFQIVHPMGVVIEHGIARGVQGLLFKMPHVLQWSREEK